MFTIARPFSGTLVVLALISASGCGGDSSGVNPSARCQDSFGAGSDPSALVGENYGDKVAEQRFFDAAWSPDGRTLFAIVGYRDQEKIVAIDIGSRQTRPLGSEPAGAFESWQLAVNFDGATLYTTSLRQPARNADGQVTEPLLLRRVPADGSPAHTIASNIRFPIASARRTDAVAFADATSSDLMIYEHVTGHVRKLGTGAPLRFSPDDRSLLQGQGNPPYTWAVSAPFAVLDLQTGTTTPLATDTGDVVLGSPDERDDIQWRSDGTLRVLRTNHDIGFGALIPPNYWVEVVDLRTGDTYFRGDDTDPLTSAVFGPDGESALYWWRYCPRGLCSTDHSSDALVRIPLKKTHCVQKTLAYGDRRNPMSVVSPQGNKIAISVDGGIYVVSL